ncbi:glycosyltransferase family 2 protein [Leclercia adecarboxylata]|uniref:glycosyltransferase family 2 protein n=1 Tax=Leclercia adecarboxylata TaxID=83655 RepID=UPI001CBEFFBA|nr:glycosyltransferase family 2 protein [Leclercia adecarboxylata]MBZ3800643.1 glycosyltransferase family 2 protein [Leclercia adecarboxylata]MBZ3805040.1 glycosyltransferase family 2 protein [Leclercia adecarboxylata]MEC3905329.1 glycosyltransferase family 2 protein [Leclercia adecarboxylata]
MSTPKVHAYIISFNEQRIIKHTLDFYNSFCSKIFLFDNGSTDNTLSIAKQFDKVKIIHFDTSGKMDDKMHIHIKTSAYKEYSREGGKYTDEIADWIICVDADEFIYHPNILDVLKEYQNDKITVPQITGFNIVGKNDLDQNIPIIRQYNLAVREPIFDKRALFKCDFNMSYDLGCHPSGPGFSYMKGTFNYKTSNKYKIALLHYKHIGNRLLESAKTNLSRFDETKIKINEKGNYVGPGAHYKFYVDKNMEESYLIRHGKKIFDENNCIIFENFTGTSGEQGSVTRASPDISDEEVKEFIQISEKIKNPFLNQSLRILELIYKHRPDNKLIEHKISEYKPQDQITNYTKMSSISTESKKWLVLGSCQVVNTIIFEANNDIILNQNDLWFTHYPHEHLQKINHLFGVRSIPRNHKELFVRFEQQNHYKTNTLFRVGDSIISGKADFKGHSSVGTLNVAVELSTIRYIKVPTMDGVFWGHITNIELIRSSPFEQVGGFYSDEDFLETLNNFEKQVIELVASYNIAETVNFIYVPKSPFIKQNEGDWAVSDDRMHIFDLINLHCSKPLLLANLPIYRTMLDVKSMIERNGGVEIMLEDQNHYSQKGYQVAYTHLNKLAM